MTHSLSNIIDFRKFSAPQKRVAIVGAGISGLSSAYHLHNDFDVTVYEKQPHLGGHTDTHCFELEGKKVRIDSGFIIFCAEYYPHFCAMLDDLGVEAKPTDMSFSAFNQDTNIVYNATNLNKLFCDRKNILKPRFWRMLSDIVRFYHRAPKDIANLKDHNLSVGEYLKALNFGPGFENDHLLPMISALWSATPQRVKLFPIKHLVEFFQAHGLMKIIGRPQWVVVKNGSASYVEALHDQLQVDWRIGANISRIKRHDNRVEIVDDSGDTQEFDAIVLACHADTSLSLLADASRAERDILGAIPFEDNEVLVHTDESVMHSNKLSWASWNTYVPRAEDSNSLNCCTANYWMNSLQGLDLQTNVFTSLNSSQKIAENKILAKRNYSHPVFTAESVAAQKRLYEINGERNTFHAGAFWGWGFHEDGARTAYQTSVLLNRQLNDFSGQSSYEAV